MTATITLDYDQRNIQARKALENMLSLGYFKLRTLDKPQRKVASLSEDRDSEFLYSASEQVLAKDWLNHFEDEAWKSL
jgi:hypothetical protein